MNKRQLILICSLILGAVLFPFTNCSGVSFNKVQSQLADEGLKENDQLSTDQLEQLESDPTLPMEPQPVTDLESDPSLYDKYKCPDSDGVVICHFPENIEGKTTQCVGRPAVSSHYDHVRYYESGGQNYTVRDYLGPCRP